MSDIMKFFDRNKKKHDDEDEEAYQEQMRAFNAAKEILRKQQLGQESKSNDHGIKINSPNIDISQMSQEDLDKIIRNREKMLLSQSPIIERDLENVPIRESRQAFGALFYSVEALEKISKFNENMINKEKQLSQALQNILQSDSKIKWINSQAVDVLFEETKKIFDQNAELVGKISIIEK